MLRYGPESLLKKARTRVEFKHPNIIQVLNYLERKETTYLVMEYGVGEDLNRYFSPPYPTESKLLAVLIPASEGLDVVHQHGFIHRDIKPENIYTRQDHSPLLMDLGAETNNSQFFNMLQFFRPLTEFSEPLR